VEIAVISDLVSARNDGFKWFWVFLDAPRRHEEGLLYAKMVKQLDNARDGDFVVLKV
jgi:hypothetical protein